MLPSVQERKRNAPFFYQSYSDACYLRSTVPIPLVKARANKNILDICVDKLKVDEWIPILDALKSDRSLHFIAIHSKYSPKHVHEEIDSEIKALQVKKCPVLYTKFVMKLLMESLAACISETKSLTYIELEGIPLKSDYIKILFKGLASNSSLQTISLHNSPIGDQGCKHLCLLLKTMPSVICLDLCNCNLSSRGALEIAETLKYQSLQRFAESWKHSLRYRNPNLELMPGLRRVTLNSNLDIGDNGVKHITDILKEDIWLKALDLQNCGITNAGAFSILNMLNFNHTMYIVDVRDNYNVEVLLLNQIMMKLFHNNAHQNLDTSEFHWTIPSSQLTRRNISCVPKNPTFISRSYSSHSNCSSSLKSETILCPPPSPNSQPEKQHLPHELNLELQHTREKLKNLTEHLEREMSLRLRAESKQNDLEFRIRQLENELQKKQKEKQGFCLMRVEAYEAILEAFKKFSVFMENITDTRDVDSFKLLPASI